jgi:hypothetical protein
MNRYVQEIITGLPVRGHLKGCEGKMRRVWRSAKIAVLLMEAALVGYAITRILRSRASSGRRAPTPEWATPDLVEEASMESFPASDPPSWIGAALE